MKLYTYDPAPSPQRLDLFLRCKGIEIDTEQVDMAAGEHLGEAYRLLVPELTVPALILDDGTILTEVIGIITYLEAMYPDPPLLGSTPLEKALISSWSSRIYNQLFMATAEALRNSSPGFKGRALPGPLQLEQIPELAERGKKRLAWAWEQLDEHFANHSWVAGDSFSFADIDLVVCSGFSGWVKCKPPENLANLHAYLARATARIG